MNKDSCFCIGFISKKIGFKGKVSIKINIGKPKDYLDANFIYVDIDSQLIPYQVTSSIVKRNIFLELKLKEVENDSTAINLLKKNVFLNKQKFQKEEDIYFYQQLINYTVLDSNKRNLGLINDVIDQEFQKLIIVKNQENQEILIPLVKDFIKNINKKNKILTLNLPEGLIDLNLKS